MPARSPRPSARPLALGSFAAVAVAAGLGGCAGSGSSSLNTAAFSPSQPPQYRLYAGDAVGRMLNAPRFEDDLGDSRFAETNLRSSIVITGAPVD